jgi:hypothetical protein
VSRFFIVILSVVLLSVVTPFVNSRQKQVKQERLGCSVTPKSQTNKAAVSKVTNALAYYRDELIAAKRF